MLGSILAVGSLIVSIIAIIANTLIIKFQINETQQFEQEKITLDLFAEFLTLSIKRTQHPFTQNELLEYGKLNAKLALISDEELENNTFLLYESIINSKNSEETLKLIRKEKLLMRNRLKSFRKTNQKYFR